MFWESQNFIHIDGASTWCRLDNSEMDPVDFWNVKNTGIVEGTDLS